MQQNADCIGFGGFDDFDFRFVTGDCVGDKYGDTVNFGNTETEVVEICDLNRIRLIFLQQNGDSFLLEN
jgi:hypothetical protein